MNRRIQASLNLIRWKLSHPSIRSKRSDQGFRRVLHISRRIKSTQVNFLRVHQALQLNFLRVREAATMSHLLPVRSHRASSAALLRRRRRSKICSARDLPTSGPITAPPPASPTSDFKFQMNEDAASQSCGGNIKLAVARRDADGGDEVGGVGAIEGDDNADDMIDN